MIENYLRERRSSSLLSFEVTNTDQLVLVDEITGTIQRVAKRYMSATCLNDRTLSIINLNMHSRFCLRMKEKLNQFWTLMHAKKNCFVVVQPHATSRASLLHW
jgi:hypothetical protein